MDTLQQLLLNHLRIALLVYLVRIVKVVYNIIVQQVPIPLHLVQLHALLVQPDSTVQVVLAQQLLVQMAKHHQFHLNLNLVVHLVLLDIIVKMDFKLLVKGVAIKIWQVI